MTYQVLEGDCVSLMAGMPVRSVDAVVCDPPYGLEFMGKDWDRLSDDAVSRSWDTRGRTMNDKPGPQGLGGARASLHRKDNPRCDNCGRAINGRATTKGFKVCECETPAPRLPSVSARKMQAWHEVWSREAFRVLKPGGHLIAAGGSRTYHRLTCAIEDAGFEIRDCITWLFGSGFPKSLNVSEALRGLPACTCDVAGELGTVDSGSPAGTVGAGVRAEAGAVPLAGFATDGAGGVGAQPGSSAAGAGPDVEGGVEQIVGESPPVVLGSSAVTGVAAGDEVGADVGSVEVEPEALRDQVVGDGGGALAAEADGTVQDARADLGPADPLVLPLAAAPGGVTGASESAPVGDGHTVPGAVDGDPLPVAGAGPSAFAAGEGRHPTKCKACGGVRGQVPDGFGTALKPAAEFWVVARKPLSGTVAATVLEHGTGALNVDGCRVDTGDEVVSTPQSDPANREGVVGSAMQATGGASRNHQAQAESVERTNTLGRWPANVVLDEEAARLLDEQTGERPGSHNQVRETAVGNNVYGGGVGNQVAGTEKVGYGDSGGASRFFYCAKSSRAERNAGLEGFEEEELAGFNASPREGHGEVRNLNHYRNSHPTVKPISLMRWLVRLVTPPGGTVLDPFCGSGSTGCAAVLEGFDFVGLEREAEYVAIAEARIRWWHKHRGDGEAAEILAAGELRDSVEATGQLGMFD